jgi:branched-chain amino acid aminotransferase
MYIFLNGQIVPAANAMLHVSDLATLRGYGMFDFLQSIRGVPLFIDDYLDRFYYSAQALGLDAPYERTALKQHIARLIKINNFQRSGLKLVLTGGYSPDGFTPTEPNFFIIETDAPPLPSDEQFKNGVKLMLHTFTRDLSAIKSTNYTHPITIQSKWKTSGAVDVLYHEDGFVTESSRSNFFIIDKKNTLITPDVDVLHGITRKKVIEIATNENINIEIRNMSLKEVLAAKEAFMTSSTKGILPVVALDENIIAKGKVGKTTQLLMTQFAALQEKYIENWKLGTFSA